MTNTHNNITGAELQTLREGCGLTREDLAQLVDVQARTVKHWESGRSGVPADVAAAVENIDSMIAGAVRAAIDQAGTDAGDVVLLRYASDVDLWQHHPTMRPLPAGVHGAIVGRTRQALASRGMLVRVVWMQTDRFDAWRLAAGLVNNEAARASWAGEQVEVQARPHRGDQPSA